MAKSGTFEHPKTKRLARFLKQPNYAALGLLEAFWHWIGRYAPTGQLDALALEDCADTLRFDDGGEALSEALLQSGWLDALEDGTYYVHDWHDHATDAVKKDLQRTGRKFANGAPVRKTKAAEAPAETPKEAPKTPEKTEAQTQNQTTSTVTDNFATVSRQDSDNFATPQPYPTIPNPTQPGSSARPSAPATDPPPPPDDHGERIRAIGGKDPDRAVAAHARFVAYLRENTLVPPGIVALGFVIDKAKETAAKTGVDPGELLAAGFDLSIERGWKSVVTDRFPELAERLQGRPARGRPARREETLEEEARRLAGGLL